MTLDVLYVTHADVAIDPDVPVPDWGLSERGKQRHRLHAQALRAQPPDVIWCSPERKARDAAAILSKILDRPVQEEEDLSENDRSATGFLEPSAFEAAADAFFAHPDQSFRGWEKARDAQARIVAAVGRIADRTAGGRICIVAHGGVGALLLCHVKGLEISRTQDQPPTKGGNAFRFYWPDRVLQHGWRDIAPAV